MRQRPESASPVTSPPPVRSVRLRLLVAIPAAMVLCSLAAGVLGLRVLQSLEVDIDAAAFVRAQTALAAGLVATALLALVIGLAVVRSVLRPVALLGEQVARLEAGQPAQAVPLLERNEVGLLGARFNTMIEALNRRAQERSQLIMEQFAGALITADGEGRVTGLNTAATLLLGIERHTAVGVPLLSLLQRSGFSGEICGAVERLLRGEGPVTCREGSLTTADGEFRQIWMTGSIDRTAGGRLEGVVVNLRDLSQMQAFHERMKASEQFAAISTFATGVAHEIRNPLASIKAMAQLLGEDVDSGSRAAHYAAVIDTEVNRLNQIVTELQAFTHAGDGPRALCDLGALIREALTLARHRHESSPEALPVPVTDDIAPLAPVRGHQDRLLQALFHVLLNAFEHTGRGGAVHVRARAEQHTAIVEVSNTRASIPPADRDRVFSPFFTTKAAGPGLGLAVARQVFSQHRGSIELVACDDPVTFRITLPMAAAPHAGGESVQECRSIAPAVTAEASA